jgi:hypothetical protein
VDPSFAGWRIKVFCIQKVPSEMLREQLSYSRRCGPSDSRDDNDHEKLWHGSDEAGPTVRIAMLAARQPSNDPKGFNFEAYEVTDSDSVVCSFSTNMRRPISEIGLVHLASFRWILLRAPSAHGVRPGHY